MPEVNAIFTVDEVAALLSKAEEFVLQNDDASAERLIQSVLAVQPSLLDLNARMGGICREAKQWARARTWMERDYVRGKMSCWWQLRYA